MPTTAELDRAQPDEIRHVAASFASCAEQLLRSYDSAVGPLATRVRGDADQVRRAAGIIEGYADQVAELKARHDTALADVTAAEVAHALQHTARERALEAWTAVLAAVGAERASRQLREQQARLALTAQSLGSSRQRLVDVLTDYEGATSDYVRDLVTVEFVYSSVHRTLAGPAALSGNGLPAPLWQDAGTGPLFSADDIPDLTDVTQGSYLGDCYFLSALMAVVSSPRGAERIKRMIVRNLDGTYTVRAASGDITVDGDLPSSGVLNAASGSLHGNWVALLEKAYAEQRGSYNAIVGGHSVDVLRTFFGVDVDRHEAPTPEDVAGLADAVLQGHPATMVIDLGKIDAHYAVGHLHEVAVIGCSVEGDDTRRFLFENPWNATHRRGTLPSGAHVQYGRRLWLTESDLLALAVDVTY